MKIHKEGTPTLLLTVFVSAILLGGAYWLKLPQWAFVTIAFICIFFFLIFLQFFRSPRKNYVLNEKFVIAPADGKVVAIEEVFETEYFNEKRLQISIFMSPFNVHSNHNPISGIVKYFKYHPGKYLVAWHPKSSTENERTTYVIQNFEEKEIMCRQIAGALARRICWYVKKGDQVKQGKEFGFIKFGSRVDVFLPLDAYVRVKIGDKTTGAETIIAEW